MADLLNAGIVLSTENGKARVEIISRGICPKGHSTCALSPLSKERSVVVIASNTINAQLGDRVMVTAHVSHFYAGMILVFVCPLLALLVGYAIGVMIASVFNTSGKLFGYVCMGIGFIFSMLLIIRYGNRFNSEYSIRNRAPQESDASCEICPLP